VDRRLVGNGDVDRAEFAGALYNGVPGADGGTAIEAAQTQLDQFIQLHDASPEPAVRS
jgi:hypothetical protein